VTGSRRDRASRIVWTVLPVVLAVFVVWGTVVIVQQVGGWLNIAAVAPVVLLLGVRAVPLLGGSFRRALPSPVRTIAILLGAVVFPLYALVGFASVWTWRGWEQLEPIPSLLVGALALGIAAWIYVHPWWVSDPRRWPLLWAVAVILILVVVPFLAFGVLGSAKDDGKNLPSDLDEAVSTLDAVVLRPSGDAGYSERTVAGWLVRTHTGVIGAGGLSWGEDGPPAFVPSDNVDTVVLLIPGAGAENDERVWLDRADDVTPPSTPAFALLETDDSETLNRWTAAIRGAGGRVERRGDARPLSGFRQNGLEPRATDIALQLAALSPESDQLLALAARHRPALFFDSGEEDHTPLNIDRLIASGKMRLCERGEGAGAFCTLVDASADLHNRATNLAFDPDELAQETTPTTIYVNARRTGNGPDNAIYLDYWWYLARNPGGGVGGALCGPGFVIAGVTCFDHQSDWEGVTVILDGDARGGPPVAVTYAQHEFRVRYTWEALDQAWDSPSPGREGVRTRFGKGINTGARPLVFVARGTHASYPIPCREVECPDSPSILDVPFPTPSSEKRHNGGRPWAGNKEEDCQRLCLEAFATRDGGRVRARWNAFSGRWGSPTCVLGLSKICTGTNPPKSPGFQDRYEKPWFAHWVISFTAGEASRTRGDCDRFRYSADELRKGERLLALGDSFSSGHGAGDYDRGTTGNGNTCFRSARAWPELVAERLGQRSMRPLACSGARIRHVIENRDRGELERRQSQVGRIRRDATLMPNTITLTIGGNDAEFASVLRTCIALNCKAVYDRPSGDTLETAALRVAARRPARDKAIRQAAPAARLVVVGYPRLFPEQKPGGAASACGAWDGISEAEGRYLNDATRFLNAQIGAAAEDAGATFVDVTESFDGHELRCTGNTYVTPFLSRTDPGWFHPNKHGHRKLADEVTQALRAPVSFLTSTPAP
jgi:lysophospholipase L1-like esterase